MSNQIIRMDVQAWDEDYMPIDNPFDENASLGGAMFETYGEELEYVQKQDPNNIWTYIDGDDGELLIVSGYHLVNRIGYLITEIPFEDDEDIEVLL